jgi:transposase
VIDPLTTQLESREVGALPILNSFLQRLRLNELFNKHLPTPDFHGRPPDCQPAVLSLLLIRNILLARQPLYAVDDWAQTCVPEHLGLPHYRPRFLNDDRLARHLDLLAQAPQAALLTDILLQAVHAFHIDLKQLHQDTTTITFHGDYESSTPDDDSPHITFGYNKDHRPDLKQLVWSVVVSSDHAVPVHFHLYPGNTSDDSVHQQTWTELRQLVGSSDFIYVGDCKLASTENMTFIDSQGGTFLSVLPRTRSETHTLDDLLAHNGAPWTEVRRQPGRRRADSPAVYHAFESPTSSREGFRIVWYRSSQKVVHDGQQRYRRLEKARKQLRRLNRLARQQGLNLTPALLLRRANEIVTKLQVNGLLRLSVQEQRQESYKQVGPGRPGPSARYERADEVFFAVCWEDDIEAIQRASRRDGVFPLISNNRDLTAAELLAKYKYQPFLERRHEQLKSGLHVMPVHLKTPSRVSSLLLLYFVSLLVYALVEREIRQRLKSNDVCGLELYAEGRTSKQPTAELLVNRFQGIRRHRLLSQTGEILRTFHDPVPEVNKKVLALLGIDPAPYGLA